MKTNRLITSVTFSFLALTTFAASDAAAQADAGGRVGGGAVQFEPAYRPKPKPRVKRAPPKVQKTAASYVVDGDRFYDAKDYDNALESYERAANLKPNAHVLFRIGWIHNDYEEYDEALPFLDRALVLDPKMAAGHAEKGYSLRHLKRYDEAETALTRAIQLDPVPSLPYLLLGDVYFYGKKDYARAVAPYKQGLQKDSSSYMAAYNLGWSYNDLANYNEAVRWLTESVRLKPDYALAYGELGYAYYKLNNGTSAASNYKRAIQLDPQNATANFGLGDVYFSIDKNYAEAAARYKAGLAIKGDNVNALYRLGYCYNDMGQFREAADALAKVTAIKPDYAAAHVELGFAYYRLNRYNEAVTVLKQAIAIDQNNAVGHYYLGLVYVAMGNKNLATAEYRVLQNLKSEYAQKLSSAINK